MTLRKIGTTTIAMLVAAVFVLAVGIYTDNGGFQLAGGIFLVVAVITGLNQARSGSDDAS